MQRFVLVALRNRAVFVPHEGDDPPPIAVGPELKAVHSAVVRLGGGVPTDLDRSVSVQCQAPQKGFVDSLRFVHWSPLCPPVNQQRAPAFQIAGPCKQSGDHLGDLFRVGQL